MYINQISKISPAEGEYIILSDYYSEGLSVTSQHETLEEAINNLGRDGNPQTIVKLVNIDIKERE